MRSTQRESLFTAIPDTVELPRVVSAASLESWNRILQTLPHRECEVMLALCEAIEHGGYEDWTGGELAERHGDRLLVLTYRPRLCGLAKKGLVLTHGIRESRTTWEQRCEPFYAAVPRSAVERWRASLGTNKEE